MPQAPVIRLHPDDGVLIARSSLPEGFGVNGLRGQLANDG